MNDTVGSAEQSHARLLSWLDARRPGLAEVRQFHRRRGAHLALLYAANGTGTGTGTDVHAGHDPALAAQERSVFKLLGTDEVAALAALDSVEHLDDLLRGFATAYDAICQDADSFSRELTAGSEPVTRFMNADDRRRQEWMIEAAFAARTGTVRHWCLATGSAADAGAPDPQRALDQATAVAEVLSALACRDGDRGRVNWLGLEPWENGQWTVRPAGLGLSHGYSGIALFLAQLGALTGRPEWLELAEAALSSAPALVTTLAESPGQLAAISGGFAGMGGVAYALGRLSVLLDRTDLRLAADLASDLAARAGLGDPPVPTHPDLFNDSWCHGLASRAAAGALDAPDLTIWLARLATSPPLSDLTVCHGEFGVLEALAILAGEEPQARATLERRAARLPDPIASGAAFNGTPGAVPTPGFLHGLAGVGYGLLRVAFPETVPSVLTLEDTVADGHLAVSEVNP